MLPKVFQLLFAADLLTASGALPGLAGEKLVCARSRRLKHPNWSMGSKSQ